MQRVDGRAGGVLERVTDGVADDRRLVGGRSLAAVVAVLDQLLGVVPGAARVGQEDGHQGAGADRAGEEAGQRRHAEAEADGDGGQDGQDAGRHELAQRVLGDDVDDLAVLRATGALHDPGDLAELAPHLEDHGARGPGDGVDRQAREEEDDAGAEQDADQDGRVEDVELEELVLRRVGLDERLEHRGGVGAEQRGRGEHGGRDRDALGDRLGGVADGVELGEDLRALRAHVAGHLRDALGVVGDRAEGVHRDDDADGGQQAATGQRHREQRDRQRRTAEQVGAEHGGADDQRRVDRGLEADREAGEDHRGGTRQRRLADVLDRAVLGAGVVAGEGQDARGHHDADDDGGRGDEARVALGGRPGPRRCW